MLNGFFTCTAAALAVDINTQNVSLDQGNLPKKILENAYYNYTAITRELNL